MREMLEAARFLGNPVVSRVGGPLVDCLVPVAQDKARPRSLSAQFGLGRQPWHMDLAHRIIPPRFVILGCAEPGANDVSTEMLDSSELRLSAGDRLVARTEPFLVRAGRTSFYSTLLDVNRAFFRYDPGCMDPCTKAGRRILWEIDRQSADGLIVWRHGLITVIDNWRMLHRRGDANLAAGRKLLRISIMERE
jgi:hypothetical protein